MNYPQSSRRAGTTTARIMPKVNQAPTLYKAATSNVSQGFYAAISTTNAGDANVQIKEKEKANGLHYIVGAAVIIAIVIYANKKLG